MLLSIFFNLVLSLAEDCALPVIYCLHKVGFLLAVAKALLRDLKPRLAEFHPSP